MIEIVNCKKDKYESFTHILNITLYTSLNKYISRG